MDSTDLQDMLDCAQPDHDGSTESTKFSSLTMQAEVVKKWHRMGATEGLKTDSEIALFLINQYENTHGAVHPPTQCPHCRSSVCVVCSACGWSVAVSDCRHDAETSSIDNTTTNVENSHRLTDFSDTFGQTFSSEGVKTECVDSDKTVFSESVMGKEHLCLETVITDQTVCSETYGNVRSEVVPDEDLGSEAKSSYETRTRVNPLVLTPPSAQLRGGWCEHKMVKIEGQSPDEQTSLLTFNVDSSRPSAMTTESVNPFSPPAPSIQLSGGCSGANWVKMEKPVSDTHGLSQACADGSFQKNISDSEHFGNGDNSENPKMEAKTKKRARFVYRITLALPSENQEMGAKMKKKAVTSGSVSHSQPNDLSDPQFSTEIACQKTPSVVKGSSEMRPLSDTQFPKEMVGQKEALVVKGLEESGQKRNRSALKCGFCRESFSTTTLLQQHVTETHMKGGLYQCPHCNKTFDNRYYLEYFHLPEHNFGMKAANVYRRDGVCNQCGKYRKNLPAHLAVHTQVRKHRCHVCGASFKTKGCLRQHVESHSVEKRYKCKDCGKRFKTQVSLCGHVASHRMKEADWKHACPICDSRQLSKSKLAIHMRQHTGIRPFVCDVCSKGYTTAHSLKLHIRCCHSSERPFVCQECGQAFAISKALKAHVRVRHQKLTKKLEDSRTEGPTVLQFLCQLCGLAFRHKGVLMDHLQSHANKRTFKCDRCDKAFNTQGCLRQHRLQVHIGRVKPYKCSQCGHCFLSPGQLKSHMRSHTGEKPFACSVCSKSFACMRSLGKHKKLHDRRRPFVCDVCGSSFQLQYRLTVHVRKHTGQKPYQCTHCGEAFVWHSGLRWHYRKNAACANAASK